MQTIAELASIGFCANDEMTKWCASCEDEDKLCYRCIGLIGIHKLEYNCESCWSVRGMKNKVDKRYYCVTCDQRCGRIRSIIEKAPVPYQVCKLAGKCLQCERIAEQKLLSDWHKPSAPSKLYHSYFKYVGIYFNQ